MLKIIMTQEAVLVKSFSRDKFTTAINVRGAFSQGDKVLVMYSNNVAGSVYYHYHVYIVSAIMVSRINKRVDVLTLIKSVSSGIPAQMIDSLMCMSNKRPTGVVFDDISVFKTSLNKYCRPYDPKKDVDDE